MKVASAKRDVRIYVNVSRMTLKQDKTGIINADFDINHMRA